MIHVRFTDDQICCHQMPIVAGRDLADPGRPAQKSVFIQNLAPFTSECTYSSCVQDQRHLLALKRSAQFQGIFWPSKPADVQSSLEITSRRPRFVVSFWPCQSSNAVAAEAHAEICHGGKLVQDISMVFICFYLFYFLPILNLQKVAGTTSQPYPDNLQDKDCSTATSGTDGIAHEGAQQMRCPISARHLAQA